MNLIVGWTEYLAIFRFYTLINNKSGVYFILRCLDFWSVNHTSIYENYELKVFKNINFFGEISNNLPNGLLETNVYKALESC